MAARGTSGPRGWGIGVPPLRQCFTVKWVTKHETLKTEEKTWEDLDEVDSYVKIGDPVVQVLEALSPLATRESEPIDEIELLPSGED